MANNFHIIVKISKTKLLQSEYLSAITLYKGKVKDKVSMNMVISHEKSLVFHLMHNSSNLSDVEEVKFDFLSGNEDDSILFESVEVINMRTKKYKYFPCKKWLGGSDKFDLTISGDFAKNQKRNCIEIFEGKDKQFYFRVKAGNYEIVAQSEGYKKKSSAIKGINSLKKVLTDVTVYDLCSNKIIPLTSN